MPLARTITRAGPPMSDNFDAYHQWLGIPKAEQPPNHYRLLGLTLFESDPKVIANAADRQMMHLRGMGISKHADRAQALLNELAAAKICLLKPEKKPAYDEVLRARLGQSQSAKQPPPLQAAPPYASAPVNAASATAATMGAASHTAVASDLFGVAEPYISPVGSSHSSVANRGASRTTAEPSDQTNRQPILLYGGIAAGVLAIVILLVAINLFQSEDPAKKPLAGSTPNGAKPDDPAKIDGSNGTAKSGNGNSNNGSKTGEPKTGDPQGKAAAVISTINGPTTNNVNSKNSIPTVDHTTTENTTDDPPPNDVIKPNAFRIALPAADQVPFDKPLPGQTASEPFNRVLSIASPIAQQLQPGLILTRFAKQPPQDKEPGAFILPRELLTPVAERLLLRDAARFYFDPTENVVAAGYLRVDQDDTYRFMGGNRFGRDVIFVGGKVVLPYTNQPARSAQIKLTEGYWPIVIASFADSDGASGSRITRRVGSRMQNLPLDNIVLHDPGSIGGSVSTKLWGPGSVTPSGSTQVLPRISVGRDTVGGMWTMQAGDLACDNDPTARIKVPMDVPGEYDLRMFVMRQSGTGGLVIGVPVNGRLVGVVLDGWDKYRHGIMLPDGTQPTDAVDTGSSLLTNQRVPVVVSVRRWGVQAMIGNTVVFKSGLGALERVIDQASPYNVNVTNQPFLGSQGAEFRLGDIHLAPFPVPDQSSNNVPVVAKNNPAKNNPPNGVNNAGPKNVDPVIKPPVAKVAERVKVPPVDKQQAAEKQIREVFQKDFAAVKKPTDKPALAAVLLTNGDQTKDDPVAAYVLLNLAKNTAAECGDALTAIKASRAIGERYEVDSRIDRLTTLTRLSASAYLMPALKATHDGAVELADEYCTESLYDDSIKCFKVAQEAARKAKDTEYAKSAAARVKDLGILKKDYEVAKEALAKLKDAPDDADANLAAGRWFWINQGEIKTAMTHFMKTADADLKALAEKELTLPVAAADQIALADQWLAASSKAKVGINDRPYYELRAMEWYEKASPTATGLLKAKADKQIDELRPAVDKHKIAILARRATRASPAATEQVPGVYVLRSLLQIPNASPTIHTIRFNPNGRITQNGFSYGRWETVGNGFQIEIGTGGQILLLERRNPATFECTYAPPGGVPVRYQLSPVLPLGTWTITDDDDKSKPPLVCTMYNNQRIDNPETGASWALSTPGSTTYLRVTGSPLEGRYSMSPDNKLFKGRNLMGANLTGVWKPTR